MWPAAIAAGASLLGALMNQKAQEAQAKKDAEMEATKSGYQAQMQGEETKGKGVQNALAQLMQQYGSMV